MSSDSASMPAGKFGFLESAVMKLLARPAVVSDVQVLTAHFRLITLQGDALKGADWVPGQKVQMQFGGFVSRTFTPIAWDAAKGETRLVGFSHGDGPGARWVVGAKPGDACVVFGPRRSLDVGSVPRPALFFGDETSFGLARALGNGPGGLSNVSFVFEVSSMSESQAVLDALGIRDAALIERKAGDAHLDAIETRATQIVRDNAPIAFVLSGKASSIQRLSRSLKKNGIPSNQLRVKPYWAPGKTGLD